MRPPAPPRVPGGARCRCAECIAPRRGRGEGARLQVLTLRQPWAALVACGAKRYETRSWATRHRGPLAIHASARWRAADRALLALEPWRSALGPAPGAGVDLPLGRVLAVVQLTACVPTASLAPGCPESVFGDFSPGRWAWRLEGVRLLEPPLPARGRLGLWSLDLAAEGGSRSVLVGQ